MFGDTFIAVILLLLVLCSWLDFAKAVGKIIWVLRIPLIIAAIIYFGPMLIDWLFGTNLFAIMYHE